MSARKQRKRAARAAREAAERREQAAAERRRRVQRLALAGAFAAVILVAAIAISLSSGGGDGEVGGAATVEEQYAGIPQQGNTLGNPDAPLTLIEFADPQCPFCARYAEHVLPEIVDRYVRPGRLRLELELLTFIGPDSDTAARAAIAAGAQDRMWQFIDLLYRNQGAENSGYVTDEFLTGIGDQIDGLQVERALGERDSGEVAEALATAQERADRLGVDSTPTFFVSRDGGRPQRLEIEALEPEAFTEQLDPLVGSQAE